MSSHRNGRCACCHDIRTHERCYRNEPGEPFLILGRALSTGEQIPALMARRHGASLEGLALLNGMSLLRETACKRYGVGFTIAIDGLRGGHWSARAVPLRLRLHRSEPPMGKAVVRVVCPACKTPFDSRDLRGVLRDQTFRLEPPCGCLVAALECEAPVSEQEDDASGAVYYGEAATCSASR